MAQLMPLRPEQDSLRMRNTGLNSRAWDRVMRFVHENLGEPLDLTALAKSACMSRFHFARMFRLRTGQSPMEYVRAERITFAKKMLAGGTYSASEIAAELGFCDQSHFTRTFRQLAGLTPKEYMRGAQHRRHERAEDALRTPVQSLNAGRLQNYAIASTAADSLDRKDSISA